MSDHSCLLTPNTIKKTVNNVNEVKRFILSPFLRLKINLHNYKISVPTLGYMSISSHTGSLINLTNEYISRILKYLEKHNYTAFKVKVSEDTLDPIPLLNLDSNYINRSANILPKQGTEIPWRLYQNYILDYKLLRIDKIKDKWMTLC